MENRISASNQGITSPDFTYQKRQNLTQDFGSPKFTRKRQDAQPFFARKAQKKTEPTQHLTFISPKKYLQHQNGGTDSFRSITSVTSFGRCEKMKESFCNQPSPKQQTSTIPTLSDIKLSSAKNFESAQQIIARVRSGQQALEFKNKNQVLDRKINQLNDKLKAIKQQNSYLYKKIEDFNGIIGQKNAIINQFSTMLKQKEQALIFSQNQIQYFKKKNEQLQSVVILLNRSLEDAKFSYTNLTDETDDGDKQNVEQQIEKYKVQIQQLSSKVKYSQIQTSMFQKMRYDLELQIGRNQKLKTQNQKLLAKVEYLTERNRLNSPHTRPNFLHVKRERDSQISLQLSPQR